MGLTTHQSCKFTIVSLSHSIDYYTNAELAARIDLSLNKQTFTAKSTPIVSYNMCMRKQPNHTITYLVVGSKIACVDLNGQL